MGQFVTMAFLQLTCRESPRDIEGNLRAQAKRQHHMGLFCNTVSRNMPLDGIATLSKQIFIDLARPLHAQDSAAIELDETV